MNNFKLIKLPKIEKKVFHGNISVHCSSQQKCYICCTILQTHIMLYYIMFYINILFNPLKTLFQ